MSKYKYIIHGKEVPLEDIVLAELSVHDSSDTFGFIIEAWTRSYNEILSEVISKIISNNLQV